MKWLINSSNTFPEFKITSFYKYCLNISTSASSSSSSNKGAGTSPFLLYPQNIILLRNRPSAGANQTDTWF